MKFLFSSQNLKAKSEEMEHWKMKSQEQDDTIKRLEVSLLAAFPDFAFFWLLMEYCCCVRREHKCARSRKHTRERNRKRDRERANELESERERERYGERERERESERERERE